MKKSKYDSLIEKNSFVSIIVISLGFLCGTILVAIVGRNPLNMYKAILQAITGYNVDNGKMIVRYIGESLNYSVPYILAGLSMGFAARSGLFNIGGEGQYIVGLTTAQIVALMGPNIPVLHWILAIAAALLVGAIWGGVVGLLKAKYEVSEVVSTIMLNYIALYLSRIITLALPGSTTYKTANFPETALITSKIFSSLTRGSLLNLGLYFMIISVIAYWFIMEKTTLGFSLKATGYNKDAAKASGISSTKSITISMAISGMFAALAGAIVALGSFKSGRVLDSMDNYGFMGIAVALVGNSSALGITLSGLLFGILKNAQALMQSKQIPKEITFIIQGLIVVFVSLKNALPILRDKNRLKKLKKEAENV